MQTIAICALLYCMSSNSVGILNFIINLSPFFLLSRRILSFTNRWKIIIIENSRVPNLRSSIRLQHTTNCQFNANFTHLNMFNHLNLVIWQIAQHFQLTNFVNFARLLKYCINIYVYRKYNNVTVFIFKFISGSCLFLCLEMCPL